MVDSNSAPVAAYIRRRNSLSMLPPVTIFILSLSWILKKSALSAWKHVGTLSGDELINKEYIPMPNFEKIKNTTFWKYFARTHNINTPNIFDLSSVHNHYSLYKRSHLARPLPIPLIEIILS